MPTEYMHAMVVTNAGGALEAVARPRPKPATGEILIAVSACGVCRTDLHIIDGEIPARYPVIPGHEVVGKVLEVGNEVSSFEVGDRVGVPWLGATCGICQYCREGRENLCDSPQFTGCTRDGGYATHLVADARYCFHIPERFTDAEAAPLLCAGLIGWRANKMAGKAPNIGLYGFGTAAHILAQIAAWQSRRVYAFTKPGDLSGQKFALELGCIWAGGSDERPLAELDAAIIFAPVGDLVPRALKAVRKGGRVVCAGIHMSDIPSFPYADLWQERAIVSVANLTRGDGAEFLAVADRSGILPIVETHPLSAANEAVTRVREGKIEGAAVLVPSS